MELNFIEVVQNVILPITTMVLGYYGWRAKADKNKLEAELKGLEHENQTKEIGVQSSWIDLYKKLHDDQAARMGQMETEIQSLYKKLKKFEDAFKKVYHCTYYDVCPVRDFLSKSEGNNRTAAHRKRPTNRQREPDDKADSTPGDNPADDSEDQPDA